MGSNPDHLHHDLAPFKVLVVGCSYGGLATAVNLLDLGEGLSPRLARESYSHHAEIPRIPVEVTIVDERDGFCKPCQPLPAPGGSWEGCL
jgi:hypothetical protein